MAGKSPRLRARAIAENFYKEELKELELREKLVNEVVDSLKGDIKELERQNKELLKRYNEKLEENERLAITNDKLKKDFEVFTGSEANKKVPKSQKKD